MKNTFYFVLTAFSFLSYLNFCSDFLDHVGKRFDKKAKINFKMYDLAGWKQPITIYTLPNILRRKGNQAMKLSKQIE